MKAVKGSDGRAHLVATSIEHNHDLEPGIMSKASKAKQVEDSGVLPYLEDLWIRGTSVPDSIEILGLQGHDVSKETGLDDAQLRAKRKQFLLDKLGFGTSEFTVGRDCN